MHAFAPWVLFDSREKIVHTHETEATDFRWETNDACDSAT